MARIGIDARLTYYRHGGIARYIHELINRLPEVDPSNKYLILHQRKDQRDLAKGSNQRRIRTWTPSHHRLERLALAVESAPHRLNLLHSPDFIPPYSVGYKRVITIHDLTFLHYPQFLTDESRRYYNDQIEMAVRVADHIMTDSEATRADVLNLLGVAPEKVTTVLLGIDESFHRPSQDKIDSFLKSHNLPSGYILFLGTLEPRKNIDGLLRAYAVLKADSPDTPPLVVAGQRGWLYEKLYSLSQDLKIADDIHWLENIPHQDLTALYSAASLLCLPSFYEGFGFPPLEAMACGTPTVVADRASLPEVVGEAGHLINPDEAESIAEGIGRVLGDSAFADDLRERGLEHVKRFDWQETARQVHTIYQKVLDND